MIKIIKKLVDLGPRYGRKESEAAKVIIDELSFLKIHFIEESFETSVPHTIKAELYADDILIPCIGSSLKSGEIKSGEYLISTMGYNGENRPFNIAYSPITDGISVVEFYEEPSVTVSRNSILQISMAREVRGLVEIDEERFASKNILVGNSENPDNIVFAHYDSVIGSGALDNAGAIGVMIEIIKENPDLLQSTLFVFAGNEEVSYDNYITKSGYGFRVFEERYEDILRNLKQIIVIDGIGIGEPSFVQTGLDWVLQLKMLNEIKSKVFWLQNDQMKVLKYFHTKDDTMDKLNAKHLEEAKTVLSKRLAKQ